MSLSADGTSLADLPLQDIANFLRGPPGSSIILWIHSREDFTVTEAEASDPNVAAAPFDPNVASEPFRTVLDQDQQMKIALEESHKEAQAARIEEDEQVKIALTKSLKKHKQHGWQHLAAPRPQNRVLTCWILGLFSPQ